MSFPSRAGGDFRFLKLVVHCDLLWELYHIPFLSDRIFLKTIAIYITDMNFSQYILETNYADMHTARMEGSDWLVRHSPLHRSLLQSKNELMIISENVSFSRRFSGKLSGSASFSLLSLGKLHALLQLFVPFPLHRWPCSALSECPALTALVGVKWQCSGGC